MMKFSFYHCDYLNVSFREDFQIKENKTSQSAITFENEYEKGLGSRNVEMRISSLRFRKPFLSH